MGGKSIDSSEMSNFYDQNAHIRKATNAQQVFTSRYMCDAFNPAKMKLPREACDSVDSPRSRGIILAEDVTGSMGCFLLSLIQNEFPRLMPQIYDTVSYDPHIMFMGVGDVVGDEAPLQVTQFETDLRILEQLQKIWLEQGGCGNGYESYILPWYFAAKHTKMDCYEKRGEKGFLFTFGDEGPTPVLTQAHIKSVFGNNDSIEEARLTGEDCLKMASKKFHCYHIMLHGYSYGSKEKANWRKLMGGHLCDLSDHTCLPELVTTILSMYEGMTKTEALSKIKDDWTRKIVSNALEFHEETVTDSNVQNDSKEDIEVF